MGKTSECFICRDSELETKDPLRNFCNCKNLLAHHVCLSTWIQRGRGSENRLRCIICKAKYQLQRRSPWRSVSLQWQTWLVFALALGLLGLVPYMVHRMMTAFTSPPPPSSFKVAAVCFGVLMEILLVKCLFSYFSTRYHQAVQSSFTVCPRGLQEDTGGHRGCWRPTAHTAGAQGAVHTPTSTTASSGRADSMKAGCLRFFRV